MIFLILLLSFAGNFGLFASNLQKLPKNAPFSVFLSSLYGCTQRRPPQHRRTQRGRSTARQGTILNTTGRFSFEIIFNQSHFFENKPKLLFPLWSCYVQKCAREAENSDWEERVDNVEGGKSQVFLLPPLPVIRFCQGNCWQVYDFNDIKQSTIIHPCDHWRITNLEPDYNRSRPDLEPRLVYRGTRDEVKRPSSFFSLFLYLFLKRGSLLKFSAFSIADQSRWHWACEKRTGQTNHGRWLQVGPFFQR